MVNKEVVYETVTSDKLTFEQKVISLAKQAEDALDVLNIPERTRHFFQTGAINDLFEGAAPYRPRYIQPDYQRFVENGSEFLDIKAPTTLDELLFSLMILYRHVPSITTFPVYLGSFDTMMEPFLDGLTDEEIMGKLRLFLTYLDRTITDSFSHANIGPTATRAGRLLLRVERELKNAVPNLTIKYDPAITPDDFMEEALQAAVECSKPAIVNHAAACNTFEGDYGVCSCYNILPIGGGSYTLTRVTLTKLVEEATSVEHFLHELLPECLTLIAEYMNERVRFLVEKSNFFESSFLVKEGLIDPNRFVVMYGVTGLAESVNALLKDKGLVYGHDAEADDLAESILKKIQEVVDAIPAVHSPLTGNKFLLHAQVGLDSDLGVTSGVRIPVGDEPEEFLDHLTHSGRYHHYFPSGVGDIFPIATHATKNTAALLDVVKGAFGGGMKYMSFYAADSDLVRITGYLVKRSEMEKFFNNEVVLQGTTHLGAPNYTTNRLAQRKVRMV